MMFSLLSKAADDGRTLTGLWKQYYEASKADRPQKEAEILQKIREEALVKRLPVDFYDAAARQWWNAVTGKRAASLGWSSASWSKSLIIR